MFSRACSGRMFFRREQWDSYVLDEEHNVHNFLIPYPQFRQMMGGFVVGKERIVNVVGADRSLNELLVRKHISK